MVSWGDPERVYLQNVEGGVRALFRPFSFCLGTGVPRHRDGVCTTVRTYVRMYVFSELCSIFQYVMCALQLSGSREHKSDYGCL